MQSLHENSVSINRAVVFILKGQEKGDYSVHNDSISEMHVILESRNFTEILQPFLLF